MIDRFIGDAGRANLMEALLLQDIVANDLAVAEKLAASGQLVMFEANETIVQQNGTDTDVYFILSGEANVFVNLRPVATRAPGAVVGEMVATNPTALRSATLKAKTVVVALVVTAADFLAAGEGSSRFWKFVARMTGDRLRQREKLHRPANPTPILFIGSSVEGIPLAREIQSSFNHDEVIARPWFTNGVFGPSQAPISDLLKQVEEDDFAVFIFGPDDRIALRDEEHAAPRDNVVFEMGLFMGRLGRDRVFWVMEHQADLKIPIDLSGVSPVTYICKSGCTIKDYAVSVCNDILKVIHNHGVV